MGVTPKAEFHLMILTARNQLETAAGSLDAAASRAKDLFGSDEEEQVALRFMRRSLAQIRVEILALAERLP